jgi:hypothetical protein
LCCTDLRSRSRRLRAAAILALVILSPQVFATEASNPKAVAAMERFLSRQTIPHEYRAIRRLEATGVGQRGWLDADTSFTAAKGLMYEVTAEGGSGYIRARVLRSLLDEEQRVIALGATAVAISRDNYQFTPEGINEQGLAVVRMRPLRKDRALIDGEIFLSPDEGELVQVEGRLARNPSFWVTRVNVIRAYRSINGVRMPVSLETKAQLRLLGSSALRMTYRYSLIDEQIVEDEAVDCAEC